MILIGHFRFKVILFVVRLSISFAIPQIKAVLDWWLAQHRGAETTIDLG
jgi:hypothetical protein